MTRDEIFAAAQEAGIPDDNIPALAWGRLETGKELLERFAAIVRAAALEEVADMVGACDHRATPKGIAAAIRVRNNPTAGAVPASES